MATLIIGTVPNATFGQMTNTMIGRMIAANTTMERLKDAIATASAGYDGTPGTEFEASSGGLGATLNLFSVAPDPETPGAHGSDYAYAINSLAGHWQTFWQAAQPYLEQLDNGTQGM